MDYSPLGSSVPGIFQASILVWIAISFSSDLPNPGIKLRSSGLQADSLLTEPLVDSQHIMYQVYNIVFQYFYAIIFHLNLLKIIALISCAVHCFLVAYLLYT